MSGDYLSMLYTCDECQRNFKLVQGNYVVATHNDGTREFFCVPCARMRYGDDTVNKVLDMMAKEVK